MPRSLRSEDFLKFADRLAALGAEPRLRIICHLLRAHPKGMVAGEIQSELGMQPSAVSHHLEKLRNENLVRVQRQGTFLRYRANPEILEELLGFLLSQCCAGSCAVKAENVFQLCRADAAPAAWRPRKEHKQAP